MSEQSQWQVAGSAAETYERALVPAVFAPWAPQVVALANPKSGERVLDVACGTGVVARLAAARVGGSGNVVGLDLNPGMLAVAALIALETPATSAPITWREASATKMPFTDASFDIVYCQLGLQFFPDRPAALREMHRVLVSEGRLGLMVWRGIEQSPGFRVLADALGRHVSPEAAAMMRAPFSLSDPEELRVLIAASGFRDIAIRPATGTVRFPSPARLVQDYAAGSPLAGFVAKVTDEARTALVSEVSEALAPFVADGALVFPIEAHLASARK
jgi:ubiquinone/menaquinone biosynthesis C-methylase UbiE